MTTVTNNSKVTNDWSNSQTFSNTVEKTLGKNDFLKLLAAELKNQDPMSTKDNKEFIAEMAQFSSLEMMNNMTSAMESLKTELMNLSQQSLLVQGSSLIGKHVSGIDKEGNSVEGRVDSISWLADNLELHIGEDKVELVNILAVTP